MRTFAQKPKTSQQVTPDNSPNLSRTYVTQSHDLNLILHLQRTIGNQAVQRLLRSNAEERNVVLSITNSPHFGHDFSQIPVTPPIVGEIQTKLAINKPGDEYEQEADRIADQVLQEKMPEEEDQKKAIQVRPSLPVAGGEREVNSESESSLNRSKGSGNSMSDQVRAFFEPRMQFDFSKVKVHTDNEAAQMNQELGSRAFTHGRDIYFGVGQYNSQSIEGQRLLAHELVHVLQQNAGPTSKKSNFHLRSNPKNTVQRAVRIETPRRRGNLFARPRLPELVQRLNDIHPGVISYAIGTDDILRCQVHRQNDLTGFDISMRDWLNRPTPEIPLRFINRHPDVTVDLWSGAGLVDIDDLLGGTDMSFQLNILHILEERFSSPGYAQGTAASGAFIPAHRQALMRERDHLREILGNNDIQYIGENTTHDGGMVFVFRSLAGGYDIQHRIGNRGQRGSGHVIQNGRIVRTL